VAIGGPGVRGPGGGPGAGLGGGLGGPPPAMPGTSSGWAPRWPPDRSRPDEVLERKRFRACPGTFRPVSGRDAPETRGHPVPTRTLCRLPPARPFC